MKYNKNIHHRRSIRLTGYDYSQSGAYFVTICTQNKVCLFGEIKEGIMQLNEAGMMVEACWNDLPNHYKNVVLNEFVVMPNHLHGIIIITNIEWAGLKPAPTGKNHGLPEMVRALKTFSSIRINKTHNIHGTSVWQRNYYEHIIRDENEFNRVREYIVNNPLQWDNDENNPVNIPL